MPEQSAQIGSIVRLRGRDWLVVPSTRKGLLSLKPLSGSELQRLDVPSEFLRAGVERAEPGSFPAPDPATAKLGDYDSAQLVFQSARFLLRNAAVPIRSFGNISIRPRPYQLVPLVLALRREVIRMLICDDVGVGKTIEALLIARELLDRGEIHRVGVLCPPHLCDQWAREMKHKFSLDAWPITASTTASLERTLAGDLNVFEVAPHFVTSTDFVKLEGRARDLFLQALPSVDFIIVDEAHTCARPPGEEPHRKLRYELIQKVAEDQGKHLVLLTATPHPGHTESYRSILELLSEELNGADPTNKQDQKKIAAYVIQRTREDIRLASHDSPLPPPRDTSYAEYHLTPAHRELVERATRLCQPLIEQAASTTDERLRFFCYYAVFSALRCIASSPAAAAACLGRRDEVAEPVDEPSAEQIKATAEPFITDTPEADFSDELPESAIKDLRRHLRRKSTTIRAIDEAVALADEFKSHCGAGDAKLKELKARVKKLLDDGYSPIVWCRYIATALYLYDNLKGLESKTCGVSCTTGLDPESVREERIEGLRKKERRILIATDCISEGVNLQETLNAVIHYDIPLNPNRLEQRAGRVDRFGQPKQVREFIMYSKDNPLEDRIFEILLQKVVTVRKETGIVIPIAGRSEAVHKFFLNHIFNSLKQLKQLTLFPEEDEVNQFVENYRDLVSRASNVRVAFRHEDAPIAWIDESLARCDDALGKPEDVKFFLSAGAPRLGIQIESFVRNEEECFHIRNLSAELKQVLQTDEDEFRFTVRSPSKTSLPYVGRLHPLVNHVAERLFANAVTAADGASIARCAVLTSEAKSEPTAYLLLRARYVIHAAERTLLEEAVTIKIAGGKDTTMSHSSEALGRSPARNIDETKKRQWLRKALDWHTKNESGVKSLLKTRLKALVEQFQHVRQATRSAKIRSFDLAAPPYDILGVILLIPPDSTR